MAEQNIEARYATGELPRLINILYIEDNRMNADLMVRRLRRKNMVVLTSETGREGIESAMRHQPDLILLDFNLPDINGLEVMKRLRKFEDTANIPIVMVTSTTDTAIRHQAYDLGCRGYLLKPIITVELIMMIERVMSKSGAAV
ncbi:MAG: response regulator [Chloroflexota bacterium]